MSDPRLAWVLHPFAVLEVPPTASRAEVERAAQKLLAQLQVGVASVQVITLPIGTATRTEDMVRWAVAELREPARRVVWELCALDLPPPAPPPPVLPVAAMNALGWARE